MILKAASTEKWGILYQGSKTKLVEKIAKYFPNATHFYDLFGGGFSMSHFMIVNRKNSYKEFHYNELRFGMCELIKDAIDGKYNYDVFKPEWISRERFFAEKDSNPYIKILWSFGNNGKNYLFNKDLEKQKRSMHQAVVFDEFDSFMESTFGLKAWPNHMTTTGKRLFLKRFCASRIELQQLEHLQQLQRLERLQQLQHLEQLEQLHFTNLDYREVIINPDSVIYCDPPYIGTADYGNVFSHKDFYDWADYQSNPVFISEYRLDDPRFTLLKSFAHRSTFSNGKNNPKIEKLFGNKAATKIIHEYRNKKTKDV